MNKKWWVLIFLTIVILGIIFIPKILTDKGDEKVSFDIIKEDDIPKEIEEILPKYQKEERALACKVDDKIYIVVTRGEKNTDGYDVTIQSIEKKKNNGKFDLIVYAEYTDPKPDEIVPQVITYPTVIAETELEKLPEKIDLKTNYIE
ncbi:protease complex subunit PrcB family protein [Senegalia massiliensis]|uniref:Protease complex subunit PrcB family protein n=1 Tax=Senegalia massiliensis TaxID=1720316 RepID=A0A845R311_9CLOT|nr:protease complex subunit PrcB family protein [Senegalia massiliensis]